MAVDVIVTSIELGTLAALLTAIEFILGVISSMSARATLHGLWLLRLHRGATERLDLQRRERRIVRKDALATGLGIWLVLGVALVESNLQQGFLLDQTPIDSDLCVSVRGRFGPKRIKDHTPSFRTAMEPWVLRIAQKMNCEKTGIASVGVGGTTDSFGRKRDMLAPICAKRAARVADGEVISRPGIQEFEDFSIFSKLTEGQAFTLFPHNSSGLGITVQRLKKGDQRKGSCTKLGLSNYLTTTPAMFQTLFAHTMNMSAAVHERICKLHGSRKKVVIPESEAEKCYADDEFEKIDNQCLRRYAKREHINSVILKNMSALFVGKNHTEASYACIDSSIEYEYVLIAPSIVLRGNDEAKVEYPVIMPTRIKPLDGHCERTIPPLAQAAIMYTLNAEWTKDELSKVPRITRFHAYMMAVSASQFPFHQLHGKENATDNGHCFLKPVQIVTEIPKDWRFGILVSGLVIVVLISTVGLVFRLLFSGEAWSVGSARWSLDKLLGKERGQEALIEVVPVAPEDANEGPTSRASLPHSLLRRAAIGQSVPRGSGSGNGENGNQTIAERLYEYRLRTLTLRRRDSRDSSNTSALQSEPSSRDDRNVET